VIFERDTKGKLYRNDGLIGTVKVDVFSPPLHTLENRWNIGEVVDFEAYVDITYELQTFDVLEFDSSKYKLTYIQKFSNFYLVRGNKVEV